MVPELDARFQAELARVSSGPVWDEIELLERVEQVARIFATAPRVGRTLADLEQFERNRPIVEAFIRSGGTRNGTAALPH